MDTTAPQDEPNTPVHTAHVDKARYRPIRLIGLLLILQVIRLVGIGAYEFAHVDLEQAQPEMPSQEEMEAFGVLLFVPPGVLALLAAVGFLFLSRRGWLLAAISQGLSLGISLWLYSEIKPGYVYPIMGYCILMVMYLNSQDVRVVFHSTRDKPKQSRKATHGG